MVYWLYAFFSGIVGLILILGGSFLGYTVEFIVILLLLNLFLRFFIHVCHLKSSFCKMQEIIHQLLTISLYGFLEGLLHSDKSKEMIGKSALRSIKKLGRIRKLVFTSCREVGAMESVKPRS